MFELTLVYQDGSRFFVGGFNSMDELNSWLDQEKTRPYWVQSTTWEIKDNTPQEN